MKYTTVLYLFFLSVSITSIQAMQQGEFPEKNKDYSFTPLKQTSYLKNMETPGEKLIQKEAECLTTVTFKEAFGEEALNSALIDGVDFSIFSNMKLEFDDPQRRTALRKIKNIAEKFKDKQGETPFLYYNILEFNEEAKKIDKKRIEEISQSYFTSMFRENNPKISFFQKSEGDQLGLISELDFGAENKIKYYIKTHSAGLQSQNSSGAKILDPKELAVYKILELFKVGCESHFFGRDLRNFYVATKDVNAEGYFNTYGQLKKNGTLDSIYSTFKKDIEYGLTTLDLLSRVLRLSDLQTNSGNFGFLKESSLERYQVKAIDFRIRDDVTYEITQDHFKGFLDGNGQFNYVFDPLMNTVLKEQEQGERLKRAKEVFLSQLADYEGVIQQTYKVVMKNLTTSVQLSKVKEQEEYLKILEKNLKQYLQAINNNFKLFETSLSTTTS